MTNPTVRIHNAESNEIIDRPMTDEEYAEYLNDIKLSNERAALEKSRQEAQSSQKYGQIMRSRYSASGANR